MALLTVVGTTGVAMDERRVVAVVGFSLSPEAGGKILGTADPTAFCDFLEEVHSTSISNSRSSA